MKMRVTVVGYYDVDLDDKHGAYGTTVPEEMAAVDLESLTADPTLFLDMVDLQHFEITPAYDTYQEDPRWIAANEEYKAIRAGTMDIGGAMRGIDAAVKMRDIEIEYRGAV